jgi:MFS family permease
VLIVAFILLSHLGVSTPYWQVAVASFLFGAGLGCTMQTIVTAVQNAVEFRDMGTATSGTTFFRQIGAAIGTAIFGAVLSSRLAQYVASELASAHGRMPRGHALNTSNVQAIQRLPEPAKHLVLTAFAHALDDVFIASIPMVVLALVVALFLKEVPLRTAASAAPSSAPGPEQVLA